MSNISQQDLQVQALYENEGLPPDVIADALQLAEPVVRTALMMNSALYRRNYSDGKEDISDDIFERMKEVVTEIAFDKANNPHVRLKAATYVWDRHRPAKAVADGGLAEFAKAIGEGIVAAREKSQRVLSMPDVTIDLPKPTPITEVHNAATAELAERHGQNK